MVNYNRVPNSQYIGFNMITIISEFGKCVAFLMNQRNIFYVTCFTQFLSPYFLYCRDS